MSFLQVKVNKNNYTLTFSGHVGIGDQDLNQSFTRSISESMERNRQPNIPGNNNFHAFKRSDLQERLPVNSYNVAKSIGMKRSRGKHQRIQYI